jgi:hypothetical protein
MTYLSAILWYMTFPLTVVVSYYAVMFVVKKLGVGPADEPTDQ